MEGAKLKFHNEKTRTLEEIAEEMNSIWSKFRAAKVNGNDARMDEFFTQTRESHKDLYSAYPTVIRHLCQEGIYSPEVFSKYLLKLKERPWVNDVTRMDSYTDYYVLLYKFYNKKTYTQTTVSNVRANYRRMLQEEHDEFKKLYDKHSGVIEEKEKTYQMQRDVELLAAFDRLAEEKKLPELDRKNIKNAFINGKISGDAIQQINTKLTDIIIPKVNVMNKISDSKTEE